MRAIGQEQHYMEHRRVRFTHRGLHRQIMVRKAHPTYTFATELIDEKPFSRKGAKKYKLSEGPKTGKAVV